MNKLLILPIVMLSACAVHSPRKPTVVTVASTGHPVSVDGLRTSEQLREYRFGRYVDPGDPLVMHESHPIYRVESTGEWDLRPGIGNHSAPKAIVTAPSDSTNDAVVAEVNRQRAVTRAVTEQTATLNQRLGEMTKAAAQSQELARQTLALKHDVAALQERMDSIDTRLSERKAAPSERTPLRQEDKW